MSEYNPPKQSELSYRFSTYATFFEHMLARLATQTIPSNGGPKPERPLAALTTRDSDDPTIALLDSWSMVGDVLTFYTERIANEGFLRTAIELDSVTRLAHLIGYQLLPGVAASTYLAFTVEAVDTSGIVTLPSGIRVQSIPGPKQKPQTFETRTSLEARPEWNKLQPDRSKETIKQSVYVKSDSTSGTLRLAGTNSGLQAGDMLLIIGQRFWGIAPSKPPLLPYIEWFKGWIVVMVQTVKPNRAENYTAITWDKRIVENLKVHGPSSQDTLNAFAFRQNATLFGYDAPRWQDMPDSLKREKSHFRSDLYEYKDSKWAPINFVKPYLQFQAFAAHSRGETHYLFVGTAGEGVFRSTDRGKTWQACNTGLNNPMINSLYAEKKILYAGTTNGTLFRSFDNGQNWEQFTTGSIVEKVKIYKQFKEDEKPKLESESIKLVSDELPRLAIHAIATYNSSLYVGTDDGVYQSDNNGVTWNRASKKPLSGVRALLVKGDQIFAGTSQRLKKASLTGQPPIKLPFTIEFLNWEDTTLDKPTHALATNGTEIWAATNDGIYESSDNGSNWKPSPRIPPTLYYQIPSALAVSNGQLLAVTPSINEIATEWPGFKIEAKNKQIDLDTVYQNVLPKSWALLINGQKAMAYQVEKVEAVEGNDFTQLTTLTRLTLSSNNKFNEFDESHLRTTEVLLQSEWLPLFEESRPKNEAVKGECLKLDGILPVLALGQRIIVSGKRGRIKISKEFHGELVGKDGQIRKLTGGEVLEVMLAPKEIKEQEKKWTLKDELGFIGVLTTSKKQWFIEVPAADTQKMVSELSVVAEMTERDHHNQLRSTIILREPLENWYDRATVTIRANVVQATQGKTVDDEVLGSGNGKLSNQRFRLRQSPLTYLSASTKRGIESTLTVRVNEIKWKEVDEFNRENERSQCYIVRQDSKGQSYVIFGDGRKGARLPTGVENVVATYRRGSGLEGNVEANTLTRLQTSPLGLLSVTNPLPASGGNDPQTVVGTRQNAPLTIMTMDRIVSLSDYEIFATTFASIGKAQATLLWTGQSHLIYLTVTDQKGDFISKNSSLYSELTRAIERRRNSSLQKMEISSKESYSFKHPFKLPFKLEAMLTYDSRYRAEKVEHAVKKALLERFCFQKQAFAQDVAASDVIELIQAVAGIIAVDLTTLSLVGKQDGETEIEGQAHRETEIEGQAHRESGIGRRTDGPLPEPEPFPVLKASCARWDRKLHKALPAQLLLIENEDHIQLTLQTENGF